MTEQNQNKPSTLDRILEAAAVATSVLGIPAVIYFSLAGDRENAQNVTAAVAAVYSAYLGAGIIKRHTR